MDLQFFRFVVDKKIKCKPHAALYANNLLPLAQLTLANFYAQTTQSTHASAMVCAVNVSNLLPYAQCTLAN
jgi:hypothetical protein